MALNLSPYEAQALAAYQWAKKRGYASHSSILPRTFHKVVESYCYANNCHAEDWKKGNGGRSLSSIVLGLKPHGVEFAANGCLSFSSPSAPTLQKSNTTTVKVPPKATAPAPASHYGNPPPVSKSASAAPLTTATAPHKPISAAPPAAKPINAAPPAAKPLASPPPLKQAATASSLDVRAPKVSPPKATAPTGLVPSRSLPVMSEAHKRAREEEETAAAAAAAERTARLAAFAEAGKAHRAAKAQAEAQALRKREQEQRVSQEVAAKQARDKAKKEQRRERAAREREAMRTATEQYHLALQAQQPHHVHQPRQPVAPAAEVAAPAMDTRNMAPCPVCQLPFPMAQIDAHLDSCLTETALPDLDEQEKAATKQREQDDFELAIRESALWEQADSSSTNNSTTEPPKSNRMDESVDVAVTKKRPAGTLDNFLSASAPPTKKVAHKPIEDDCVIVQVKPAKYLFEQDSDDDDDEGMDMYRKRKQGSRHWKDEEDGEEATKDAEHPFGVPSRTSKATPSTAGAQPAATPAKGAPAARPPVDLPNSGGLFSERHFKNDLDKECPICFEEFEAGTVGIQLPCLCLYHLDCIRDWLGRKPRNCPSHGDF